MNAYIRTIILKRIKEKLEKEKEDAVDQTE